MQFTESHVFIQEIHTCIVGGKEPGFRPPSPNPRYSDCLVLFQTGCVDYIFPDRSFTVHSGDVLYLAKGETYAMRTHEKCRLIYVDFDFARHGTESFLSAPYPMQKSASIEGLFARLANSWIAKSELSWLQCTAILYEILCEVAHQSLKAYFSPKAQQYVRLTIDYMEEHLADASLGVEMLAQVAQISTVHLRRIYEGQLGISPVQYLRHLRIKRAKGLLKETRLSIHEIAARVGYGNVNYFCRVFREISGITPSQYRAYGV